MLSQTHTHAYNPSLHPPRLSERGACLLRVANLSVKNLFGELAVNMMTGRKHFPKSCSKEGVEVAVGGRGQKTK